MAFECSQCGECCSEMGIVHRLKEEISDREFLINNAYTGETQAVTLDPDKVHLYRDRSIFHEFPRACPFLRFDPCVGVTVCTVHNTWPEICKEFSCWRLLILHPNGRRAGRVMGWRHLASEDQQLSDLWESHIRSLKEDDDLLWEEKVLQVLEGAGYRVRR